MHEKKPCPRCQRGIDAYAKICPFCNYDQQSRPRVIPPPAIGPDGEVIEAAPPQSPPIRRSSRFTGKRVLVVVAVILLLASTFAVGALVNVIGSRNRLAKQAEEQKAEKAARTAPQAPDAGPADTLGDLRMVPVDPTATVGESITSIPVPDPDRSIPQELQRSDATALPSEQYSRILQQSQPPSQPASGAAVDPRTLPGGIEEIRRAEQARIQRERAREAAAATARAAERTDLSAEDEADPDVKRTNPVPIHQPLPDIKNRSSEIREDGTMRFDLRIGTDGRVKEVRILQSMPNLTARTVAAIQRWRFKPATRDGEPVEGNFQVDISFNAP